MGKSASTPAGVRRPKVVLCRIEGCRLPVGTKTVNTRYRICESCIKSTHVIHEGTRHRFCQQCSRLQPIEDFGVGKKSCRESLMKIGKRRRDKLALEEEEVRQAKKQERSLATAPESQGGLGQSLSDLLGRSDHPPEALQSGNLALTPPSQRSMPTQADFLRLLALHVAAGSTAGSDVETPTSTERVSSFPTTPSASASASAGTESPRLGSSTDESIHHHRATRAQPASRLGQPPAPAQGNITSLTSGRSVIVRGQPPVYDCSQQEAPVATTGDFTNVPTLQPGGQPSLLLGQRSLNRQTSGPRELQQFASFLEELSSQLPTQVEAPQPQIEEPLDQLGLQFPPAGPPLPHHGLLLRYDSLDPMVLPSPPSFEPRDTQSPPWC